MEVGHQYISHIHTSTIKRLFLRCTIIKNLDFKSHTLKLFFTTRRRLLNKFSETINKCTLKTKSSKTWWFILSFQVNKNGPRYKNLSVNFRNFLSSSRHSSSLLLKKANNNLKRNSTSQC